MPPNFNNKFSNNIVVALIVLVMVALGTAGYLYYQNNLLNRKISTNSAANSQAEADQVIAAVGKLLILPENEKPTVATVADPTALRNQPFFAQAAAGDKVLIYTNAKEAILYRPSVNKIIAISPIVFETQTAATASPSSKK